MAFPPARRGERLRFFQMARIVYDATIYSRRRIILLRDRIVGQTVRAAGSGNQNIVEGSRVPGAPEELEITLTKLRPPASKNRLRATAIS